MSSSCIPGLLSNKHWPGTVDLLLGDGTRAEQVAARETLWVEVQRYVVRFARLPIGPLTEDPDVRLNIAVSLLRRLEQDDYRHIRIWRERQRQQHDGAAWWGWIGMMTQSLAIDLARGSCQDLGPRGEPDRWARVVAVDPAVFDEAQRKALGQALDFLEQAPVEDLVGYLAALQDRLCGESEGGGGDSCTERAPPRVKRGGNSDGSGAR